MIADVVPLYRPEVAAFVIAVPLVHHLASVSLGTFHERRGEQALAAQRRRAARDLGPAARRG